jgi:tetratricopeptide (TPR) repeat protein
MTKLFINFWFIAIFMAGLVFHLASRRLVMSNMAYLMVSRAALSGEQEGVILPVSDATHPFVHGLLDIYQSDADSHMGATSRMQSASKVGDHQLMALYWQVKLFYLDQDRVSARQAQSDLVLTLESSYAAKLVSKTCASVDTTACVSLYDDLLQRENVTNQDKLLILRTAIESISWRNHSGVEKWSRLGIELAPSNVFFHRWFTRSLARQSKLQEALAAGAIAKSLGDDSAEIDEVLGIAHYRLGNWPEAEKRLLASATKNRSIFDTWYYLGEVYWSLGNHHAADQAWQQALKISPTDARVLEALSRKNDE